MTSHLLETPSIESAIVPHPKSYCEATQQNMINVKGFSADSLCDTLFPIRMIEI